MKNVSVEEIIVTARLAKLELTESEIQGFREDFSRILEYMEKLSEVDTSGIEPLSHPLELVNILRADTKKSSLPVKEALRNAPETSDKFFRVPKVIR